VWGLGGERPVGVPGARDLRSGKVYQQRTSAEACGVPPDRDTKRRGTKSPQARREIFEDIQFSFDILSQRLRELAFLNEGVEISIDDERSEKKHSFNYQGGSSPRVSPEQEQDLHPPRSHLLKGRRRASSPRSPPVQRCYNENIFTFANSINTHEGGASQRFKRPSPGHQQLPEPAQQQGQDRLSGDDVREGSPRS